MTDRETFIEFWTPTLGATEAERMFHVKQDREANPIRSAAVYCMPSYQSPITGKWIDTPSQRRDDLARNGSRPWEGLETEKAEAARQKEYAAQESDKMLETAVAETMQTLPESTKRVLL